MKKLFHRRISFLHMLPGTSSNCNPRIFLWGVKLVTFDITAFFELEYETTVSNDLIDKETGVKRFGEEMQTWTGS